MEKYKKERKAKSVRDSHSQKPVKERIRSIREKTRDSNVECIIFGVSMHNDNMSEWISKNPLSSIGYFALPLLSLFEIYYPRFPSAIAEVIKRLRLCFESPWPRNRRGREGKDVGERRERRVSCRKMSRNFSISHDRRFILRFHVPTGRQTPDEEVLFPRKLQPPMGVPKITSIRDISSPCCQMLVSNSLSNCVCATSFSAG